MLGSFALDWTVKRLGWLAPAVHDNRQFRLALNSEVKRGSSVVSSGFPWCAGACGQVVASVCSVCRFMKTKPWPYVPQ
ncbi:hypothetical protein ElyMa_006672100 [Elysia marginata]|uniref:Uncharacterized protein n=1 Tax=Elysia marginata TaxID=1093978 RepID=A0AAV4ILP3_9GAST|nr:hypothetical protein ElyMa_006672100 [Elysia marginata]